MAALTVLFLSLFLIDCLAQNLHVSLLRSLSGTELRTTSEFWQYNLATCSSTGPSFCVGIPFFTLSYCVLYFLLIPWSRPICLWVF